MALYKLGDFTFVNLTGLSMPGGAPETVRQTAVPVQRPGVAGTGFITTAIKGRPFQMRSIVDTTSVALAQQGIRAYEESVNDSLLELYHANTNYNLPPVYNKYWVLDVSAGWRKASVVVGGLTGGSVLVEAVWTLIPVYVAPA